ncbi:hypothetical protein [Paractinoplanes durhamensis]|uniref:PRC-barrel domain-containing protein n=1 Tax=Paractinoplanes durhamensis TaxID=113563 RepID=A0ABQ3Z9V9_9ACTN|nr:hypothetical protein [Actinoplanes durhamensis]GIE06620.1 hypothetical protein Adu01nite_79700 [Actinoplanes durhamensis]
MQVSDAGRLRSFEVHSADGHFLGHVGTVYRAEDSVQPLLVSFPAERDTPFVAPLFGAELTAHTLVLAYPAAQVTDGPTVDTDVVLSAGEVGAVLGYYGRRVRFSRPLTERREGTGDVAAAFSEVQVIPPVPGIGDEDLPPIVVTRPGLAG